MREVFDPREARRFAGLLRARAEELRQLNRAVSLRLNDLHVNGWSDTKYVQFETRYGEASMLLHAFAERAERYARYLDARASRIEPYLERNY